MQIAKKAKRCRVKFNAKARGRKEECKSPRRPRGEENAKRKQRKAIDHREHRGRRSDLTQRREEDAKTCQTEGVKGENKYGLLPYMQKRQDK